MKEPVIEKIYEVVEILNKERGTCRDYGAGNSLYHSEVHLIIAIMEHPNANASELADVLGITNGAITQVADKLERKGLIERYWANDNKKNTYFRLTESGELVYHGHVAHHDKMNAKVVEYHKGLSESEYRLIADFANAMLDGFDPD
jgi:DNA-binding MarR family transcriptional regulator